MIHGAIVIAMAPVMGFLLLCVDIPFIVDGVLQMLSSPALISAPLGARGARACEEPRYRSGGPKQTWSHSISSREGYTLNQQRPGGGGQVRRS